MKKFTQYAILLFSLFLITENVFSQAVVTIVKSGAEKVFLDISGLKIPAGSQGMIFKQTLAEDLKRSGWFEISAPGKAAIVVRGSFLSAGNTVTCNCEVRNVASSGIYFRRAFKSDRIHTRRMAHRIADAIVMAVKKVPGIASTRIAMVGAHGAKKDLYMCDADGNNIVRLTSNGAICISPNWTPDGRNIIYTSFYKGFPDLYLLDLARKKRTKISGFSGINVGASIAPDGRRMALVLSKDGNPELYVMDMRSKHLTRITKTLYAAEASPAWSPDGSQIVYVSDSSGSPQLYIVRSTGGRPRRITFRGTENVSPDWSRNGRRIAYSSRRNGRYHLCVYDTDTGQSSELTKEYIDYESPSWAPDSRHIVCVKTVNYSSALYILDTMGDPQVRLMNMSGEWYAPAWSPE